MGRWCHLLGWGDGRGCCNEPHFGSVELKVNCGPFGEKCTRLEGGDTLPGWDPGLKRERFGSHEQGRVATTMTG